MTTLGLAERLANPSSRNDALGELGRLIEEARPVDSLVISQVADLIRTHEAIGDTHAFASLLVDLDAPELIPPLVEAISGSPTGSDPQTLDFLYALGSLLGEHEAEPGVFTSSVIEQLGNWMLTTGGGELSWKAGVVLSNIRVPGAFALMREGARDASLFHDTRVWCLRGLVNGCGASELPFLHALSDDADPHVRANAREAVSWLEHQKDAV